MVDSEERESELWPGSGSTSKEGGKIAKMLPGFSGTGRLDHIEIAWITNVREYWSHNNN